MPCEESTLRWLDTNTYVSDVPHNAAERFNLLLLTSLNSRYKPGLAKFYFHLIKIQQGKER